MEKFTTLSEAKAHFSAILDRVEQGEEIVVTRMGRPVARLVRYQPTEASARLGFAQGEVRIKPGFDQWDEAEARALGITEDAEDSRSRDLQG